MGVKIEKHHIDNIFTLTKSGSKGWYSTNCPYCGKEEHLGINFGGIGSFNCFKCGEKGTIFKLLKFIGRTDIIAEIKSVHLDIDLTNKISEKFNEEFEYTEMIETSKPIGFRLLNKSKYLYDRGIGDFVYKVHKVGETRLSTKLKNYIIFLFYFNEKLVGWIGRSTLSQKEIDKIEKRTERKYLRYINSPGADFSKYLFGIDEITENTDTIILVEGIFDKLKIDTLLELYKEEHTKSLACFGKKVSDSQLFLISQYSIKNIILIYDSDAVKESKRYSNELNQYFNVQVGYCKKSDPGEMNHNQINEVLINLQSPEIFNTAKVSKKKLI